MKPGTGLRAPHRETAALCAHSVGRSASKDPGAVPCHHGVSERGGRAPGGLLSGRPTLSQLARGRRFRPRVGLCTPKEKFRMSQKENSGGNSDKTASMPFPIDDGLQEKVLITFVELLIKMTFAPIKTQTQAPGRQSACRPFQVAVSPRSAAGLGPERPPRSPHRTVDVQQAAHGPTGVLPHHSLTFVRFLTHLRAARGGRQDRSVRSEPA